MSSSSHKKFGVISIINVIIDLCNKYFWSGVAAAEGKEEENKTKLARARGMTQEMRRVRCRQGCDISSRVSPRTKRTMPFCIFIWFGDTFWKIVLLLGSPNHWTIKRYDTFHGGKFHRWMTFLQKYSHRYAMKTHLNPSKPNLDK